MCSQQRTVSAKTLARLRNGKQLVLGSVYEMAAVCSFFDPTETPNTREKRSERKGWSRMQIVGRSL